MRQATLPERSGQDAFGNDDAPLAAAHWTER
jgi:hypothetical protein